MATIANLNIKLTMEDHATKVLKRAQRDFVGLGNSMKDWGTGFMAGVTLPIVVGTAAIMKAASDQQEAINAVSEVYGSASQAVIDNASAAATAMGLSKSEYLSSAAVLGVYADAAGLAGQDAVKFANDNLQLAADLGSFYNASTSDVQAALTAAYRGEFDALDRFGIMLNQATLEQYALAEGIWDGNGAMTHQQRILATNAYMQQRAGAAAGDFARTSNSLANSQKILRAQLKDLAAQLGQILLPTVTRMVAVMRDLIARFQALPESWQRWIVIIGLAAAAIGPLLITLGTLLTVLPAIGAAFAILTGPIGLVIGAIALLTAAYIGNWWGFRDAVDAVAGAVVSAVSALGGIDAVRSTATSAINAIKGTFDRVTGSIGKFGSALMSGDWRTAIAAIGDFLAAPAKAIGDFIKGITTGFAPLDSLLTNVGNMFTDFGRIIQEIFQGDFGGALDVFERAIKRIPEIVQGAFNLIPWSAIGTAIVTAIQGLPELVGEVTTILKQKGIDLLLGILQGLNEQMPVITTWLGLVGQIAWDAVSDVTETLRQKGKDLLGGVIVGFNDRLEAFKLAFGDVPNAAAAAVGIVTETLLQKGKDLIQGVIDGAGSMFPALKSKIGEIPDIVTGAATDVFNAGFNLGWNLGDGIIAGINAIWNSVIGFARSLAAEVIDILTLEWLIGSPSKVTRELGMNLGEGLVIGMERSLPQIESATRAMAAAGNVGAGFAGPGGYGTNGGAVLNIYGTYNEADRHWEPENTLNSWAIARSRG